MGTTTHVARDSYVECPAARHLNVEFHAASRSEVECLSARHSNVKCKPFQ